MLRSKCIAALVVAASVSLGIVISPAAADVAVSPVIGNHAVLQREMPVPIWGTAAPGEKVTVSFRDQQKSTTADPEGKWLLRLDPLKAGGPDTLKIAGANTLTFDDVLVGEVWVGSGQSNMNSWVELYAKGDPVLAEAAAKPHNRLRLIRSDKPGWQEAKPENIAPFSALLFFFGVSLQKDLDVPVGLAMGAVGGSPSGHWLSEQAFRSDAACQELMRKLTAEAEEKHQQELGLWEKAASKAKQDGAGPPRKPNPPQKPGECHFRGNYKMGDLYATHIRPFIPYAIRGVLWDQGEYGTGVSQIDQCTLMGALIRGWREDWGQGEFPFVYVQKPSGGGCAWDPADPVNRLADKFAPLPTAVPSTGDGLNEENHIRIMRYPRVGMVISSDLGGGLHPFNKSGYGTRAARVALGMVYERKVEYYGPLYESHKIEGGKVRVSFTHVGQGLARRHGEKLQGFAIAGDDKVFLWADATIDGDTVVLANEKVPKPAAVRYGWGQTFPWANLFNKDGLPAVPFRTDSW